MADTICFNCGEPWDWWYIRDDVCCPDKNTDLYPSLKANGGVVKLAPLPNERSSSEADGFTFSAGMYIERCPACPKGVGEFAGSEQAAILSAIADVLGDDTDGFIAEAEDFGLIGGNK